MYYIHVLHTTSNSCQPDRLATLNFSEFWSFVTNIRTSMLPNKFYGRAQPNWDNFDFDFDNCGSYFWKILAVFDLFTIHIFANGSRYAAHSWLRAWIVQKRNPLRSLSIHILNPMFVRISWNSPKKHPNENFQIVQKNALFGQCP